MIAIPSDQLRQPLVTQIQVNVSVKKILLEEHVIVVWYALVYVFFNKHRKLILKKNTGWSG